MKQLEGIAMMSKKSIWTVIIGSLFLVSSCGDSSFSGKTGRASADSEEAGKITGDNPYPEDDPGKDIVVIPGDDLNSDDRAVNKCLRKFGPHPFDKGQVQGYRKINTSVSVFGFGNGIVDDQRSVMPELVLIDAAVNVLGEQVYKLLNPNAFYCLKVDVNVRAKTTIELACNARLADNKVNVGVMSNSQPTGVVGVHVMSEVQVVRVGGKQCE